jgi:hypothetical protein
MPKNLHKGNLSKKGVTREISDHELLQSFLGFHLSRLDSARLKIVPETRKAKVPVDNKEKGVIEYQEKDVKTGNLLLMYREFSASEYQVFCKITKVNSRTLLLLNPELGDHRLISAIYGSFHNANIFDFRLSQLSIEGALERNGKTVA